MMILRYLSAGEKLKHHCRIDLMQAMCIDNFGHFVSRKNVTFGVLNTLAKAFSCRLTPTANMRKPRPGA